MGVEGSAVDLLTECTDTDHFHNEQCNPPREAQFSNDHTHVKSRMAQDTNTSELTTAICSFKHSPPINVASERETPTNAVKSATKKTFLGVFNKFVIDILIKFVSRE